jgi:glycosyltransferase 2 family protein
MIISKTTWKYLKYIIFLSIGILIFWLFYRKFNLKEVFDALKHVNYFWVIVSILFSLLSQVSRAIRWKMLIKPLGYNPRTSNIFLSVLVLYFTNLIFPRGGEVARCTILSRYEKIPLTKLIGTMIFERITDFVTMMVLGVFIFIINFSILKKFIISHPTFGSNVLGLLTFTNIILCIALIVLILVIFFIFKPIKKEGKLYQFLRKVKHNLQDGFKTFHTVENKWLYLAHTMFIFLMWLLMLYVVFLAFEPTKHLGIGVAMFVFLMGGLAMLMPVQGGIGAWHFIVAESLVLYGISVKNAGIFALVAHTTTSLIYIVLGGIALILFPILNRKIKHHTTHHHHLEE